MQLSFTHGRAAKWDRKDRSVQAATKQTFGFNWWLWVPFLRLRVLSYGIYFDSSWLCFWWGFTLLYRTPNQDAANGVVAFKRKP